MTTEKGWLDDVREREEWARNRLDARRGRLVPDRHPQQDFFIADFLDAIPKDDTASMEHPLFALKTGDKRVRVYEHRGVTVRIEPGYNGCATIHDKDLWIFAISQLVLAADEGRRLSRTVRFTAHDFLVSTNRQTSGQGYKLLTAALNRLAGTRIETNIETDGRKEKAGFGLVDSWRIVERANERMVALEMTLPDWLFRAVQARQVLTISRDYFRIRRPLDRRIYELARKHCGAQPQWSVSMDVLYKKTGATDALRNFRGVVKKLAATDDLPGYTVHYDSDSDLVTFRPRPAEKRLAGGG